MDWDKILGFSGFVGWLVTEIARRVVNRRRERATDIKAEADSSKAEAEAAQLHYAAAKLARETAAAADERVSRALESSDDMREMVQAVRDETNAKIAEAVAKVEMRATAAEALSARLAETVDFMAQQLDRRTVDQGKVELAERQLDRYDYLEREYPIVVKQRDDALARVDHLEIRVGELEARLVVAEEDIQRYENTLRAGLSGGENTNG